MTAPDLSIESLRRLLDEATPGPWQWNTDEDDWPNYALIGDGIREVIWWDFDLGFRFESEECAALIALSPALAREVLRLREALEEIDMRGLQYDSEDLADIARAALRGMTVAEYEASIGVPPPPEGET